MQRLRASNNALRTSAEFVIVLTPTQYSVVHSLGWSFGLANIWGIHKRTVNCKLQKKTLPLVCLLCNTIMTTESTCSYHFTRKTECAPKQPTICWKVRWLLHFVCSSAPLVAQHYKCVKNFSAWIQLLQKMQAKSQREAIANTPIINHPLRVKWPLHLICSYAPLVTQHYRQKKKQCRKLLCNGSLFFRKVSGRGSHFVLLQIDTLCCQQKELALPLLRYTWLKASVIHIVWHKIPNHHDP